MGIAENIKENLKLKIQNNLDRNYIRNILRIIGKRPVLSAYGATFSSRSDKYLNVASIKSVSRAYNPKTGLLMVRFFYPMRCFMRLTLLHFYRR